MSRVLKFDLKKIDLDLALQYLSSICNQEGISANAEVLTLIARAADGSIRDGLSILDQAINLSENNELSLHDLKDMLNVSDDADTIELLNLIFSADIKAAVKKYREMIENNASALKVINALIDNIHTLACIKTNVSPLEMIVSEDSLPELKKLAEKVSLAAVSKIWQMLLKGISELKFCERSEVVLEMLLIRISYASELPDLQELINGVVKNFPKSLAKSEKIPHIEDVSGSLADEALGLFPGAEIKQ
jgi:DNA polymerase-3 subunit gamma/tau